MNSKPTLSEGVILALLASIVSVIIFMGMISFFSAGIVFRMLISVLGLIYILYLFSRHSEKTGKMTVIAGWLAISTLIPVFSNSILLFVSLHISMIWIVRSLYFYNSLWSSALDLALNCFALLAGIFTWQHTSSLLLALWCFFLIQAMFVFIPKQLGAGTKKETEISIDNHTFEHACHQAQIALQRMKTR